MHFASAARYGGKDLVCVDGFFSSNSRIEGVSWTHPGWPLRDCLNLKNVFNFYCRFDLSDLAKSFRADDWLVRKQQMEAITHSFRKFQDFEDIADAVPEHLIRGFLQAEVQLFEKAHKFLEGELPPEALDFALRFDDKILEKLHFPIRLATGDSVVRLDFAKNFRFRSVEGFNLFNLAKEKRDILAADDDSILFEADFRQFELRKFLQITKTPVDFENREIYSQIGHALGFSDPKIKVNAYNYGPKFEEGFEKWLPKRMLLSQVEQNTFRFEDKWVILHGDEDHDGVKVHSIVQSLAQMDYIAKLKKIFSLLESFPKSKFLFPLHDSMIFSVSKRELDFLKESAKILEDDVFKIKMKIGKNFREMKEIKSRSSG